MEVKIFLTATFVTRNLRHKSSFFFEFSWQLVVEFALFFVLFDLKLGLLISFEHEAELRVHLWRNSTFIQNLPTTLAKHFDIRFYCLHNGKIAADSLQYQIALVSISQSCFRHQLKIS